jgi:fatty acid-binding protein DegV
MTRKFDEQLEDLKNRVVQMGDIAQSMVEQAMQALVDTVVEDAARLGRLKVGLLHACHPDRMAALRDLLVASGADIEIVVEGFVGAVIGTYAGPGALGVTYVPAST